MTVNTEDCPRPNNQTARRLLFCDPQPSPMLQASFENIPIAGMSEIEQIQRHIEACYNNKPIHGRVQTLRNGDPEKRNGRKELKLVESRTQKRPLKENSNLSIDEKLPEILNQSRFDSNKKFIPCLHDNRRVTPLIYRRPTSGFHKNPTEERKHEQAKQAYHAFLEARKLQRKNTISSASDLHSDESDCEDDSEKPKFGDPEDDGLIFQLEM